MVLLFFEKYTNFKYVIRISEKMTKNQHYWHFQKIDPIFMT